MRNGRNGFVKSIKYLCLVGVIALGLMTIVATGGGDGDGAGDGGTSSLATGEFTKTVTLATTASWTALFGTFNNSHEQHLYLASDIDGSGYIHSIELRLRSATTGSNCPDLTIRMGHTSLTGLTDTFAGNVEQGKGTLETVRTGAFSVPAGLGGDYFEIILDTPFLYNGVDNLVVEFLAEINDVSVVLSANDTTLADGTLFMFDLTSLTGTLYPLVLHTKFNFAGGVNAVEFSPSADVGNDYPLGGVFEKVQLLYDAALIDGSGPITGIAMRVGDVPTTDQSYTYTMKLGHSTLTDLTKDFNGNFSGTPVTVADNEAFIVPAGIPVGDYIWIPMPDGTFSYNGSDNLIVEIEVSSSTGVTRWGMDNIGPSVTRAIGDLGSDTASEVDSDKYHISFRFNGGTMDVITVEDTSWRIFSTADHKSQIMFGAQQLGTGGPVTGISFRLQSDSVACDYPAATVVLGHTPNTALFMTFADNMTDATTVFTGTITIPAGLKAGDWVTIPISGFTYDSTQNLVVEVSMDPGATAHRILSTNADVPGPSGLVTGNRADLIASQSVPGQSDIRFNLSK